MKKNNGITNIYTFMKKKKKWENCLFVTPWQFFHEITLFDVPRIKNSENTLLVLSLFYENIKDAKEILFSLFLFLRTCPGCTMQFILQLMVDVDRYPQLS